MLPRRQRRLPRGHWLYCLEFISDEIDILKEGVGHFPADSECHSSYTEISYPGPVLELDLEGFRRILSPEDDVLDVYRL